MSDPLFDRTSELTPRDAFVCAFDEAIQSTVKTLTEVGLDSDSIWNAFSQALELFSQSAAAVERETFKHDFFPPAQQPTPAVEETQPVC